MNLLAVMALFFAGSGAGQYLLKQISINVANSRIICIANILYGLVLMLILALTQASYLLSLNKYEINVVYPLVVGSSFLGVTTMSLIVLQEQIKPNVIFGLSFVVAGLIITRR